MNVLSIGNSFHYVSMSAAKLLVSYSKVSI